MPELVVVVPTFGRPQNAWRLVKAFEETCVLDTELVFVLDDADETRGEYPLPHLATATRGMIPALNAGATALVRDLKPFAIGFMGDDHLPRTPGWDGRYVASLRSMGTGFVYGNDLIQGARIPTQVAMTANIVEALGYMAPPTFKHLFVDDAWKDMGQSIRAIQYLPDVVVEHLHPLGGTAEWDDNYERVNDTEVARADQLEYTRWKNQDLWQIKNTLLALEA